MEGIEPGRRNRVSFLRIGAQIEKLLRAGSKIQDEFVISAADRKNPRRHPLFLFAGVGAAVDAFRDDRPVKTLIRGQGIPATAATKIRRGRDVDNIHERRRQVDQAHRIIDGSAA